MIKTISNILCMFIPAQSYRRKCRSAIYDFLCDITGKIHYYQSLLCKEFAQPNKLITISDKILIIAPHPDDDCIGCGGILCKYKAQADVMVINSSGVKYPWDECSAEQIADIRIAEFYNAMDFIGIKHKFIWKIYGDPPHFDKIIKNIPSYMETVDFSQYTHIFIPDLDDYHREHQFVSKYLLPFILKKVKYRKDMKICYYSVWNTVTNPNYFEDITDYIDQKQQAILLYKSRTKNSDNYAMRVIALNYYYGLLCNVKYSEAFRVEFVKDYLNRKYDRNWAKR